METKERRNRSRTAPPKKSDQVYTQPKPFLRNRFLLHLVTVVAVVLALVFGMSIFFKVENITVTGTTKYDQWTVREASGIIDGENLLALSKARISGSIMAELPYINTVRVGIALPDTVHIQVTELEVVYSAADTQGNWWLISADGKVIDSCEAAAAEDYTKLLGVQLTAPAVGSPAVAYEPEPETDEDGVTVPVTVFAKQKLETALSIFQDMEKVGLIGVIASVDVTQPLELQLWYGTRFQLLLGDSADLYKKLDALKQAAEQMDPYDSGILDASFTIWPDQVGYTPFS